MKNIFGLAAPLCSAVKKTNNAQMSKTVMFSDDDDDNYLQRQHCATHCT